MFVFLSTQNSVGSIRVHDEDGSGIGSIHPWDTRVRLISMGVTLIALAVLVHPLLGRGLLGGLTRRVEAWGVWGPVGFGVIYVVSAVLFVPGSGLTVLGGVMFGLLWGTVTVSLASTLAAGVSFLIARYVGREAVEKRIRRHPRFGMIDRTITRGGWRVVGLMRVSPVVPFSLGNYLFGLTGVRFVPYIVSSWAGMIPGTLMYVYIGTIMGRVAVDGHRQRTTGEWIMMIIGLAATVAVVILIVSMAGSRLEDHEETGTSRGPVRGVPVEGDDTEDTVSPDATGKGEMPRRLRTTTGMWVVVGIVGVIVAACAHQNPGGVEGIVSRLFGPPRVRLSEAYADDIRGSTFDHSAFDTLLKAHVDAGGWVDYDGLQRQEDRLDAYIVAIAAAPFDRLSRDEKLTLLINAYNAFTLKLILDYHPIGSIKDIPSDKRWDHVRWDIGGEVLSLNQIEHERIRPKFREPRIHFALVCAAAGCPPLRPEAYAPDRLGEQLRQQTQYVHDHKTWFVFDPETRDLGMTRLYNWYGGDFEQVAGTVQGYAAGYAPELKRVMDSGEAPSPRWLDYDWSLNDTKNRHPR